MVTVARDWKRRQRIKEKGEAKRKWREREGMAGEWIVWNKKTGTTVCQIHRNATPGYLVNYSPTCIPVFFSLSLFLTFWSLKRIKIRSYPYRNIFHIYSSQIYLHISLLNFILFFCICTKLVECQLISNSLKLIIIIFYPANWKQYQEHLGI